MLQAGRSRVRVPIRWIFFFNFLILPAALGPVIDSASNRNEYQESSGGIKGSQCTRLTTLLPSVSQLSKENVGTSTSHNPMGLHSLLQRQLYLFFYLPYILIINIDNICCFYFLISMTEECK
jgi:hypothetical protein